MKNILSPYNFSFLEGKSKDEVKLLYSNMLGINKNNIDIVLNGYLTLFSFIPGLLITQMIIDEVVYAGYEIFRMIIWVGSTVLFSIGIEIFIINVVFRFLLKYKIRKNTLSKE